MKRSRFVFSVFIFCLGTSVSFSPRKSIITLGDKTKNEKAIEQEEIFELLAPPIISYSLITSVSFFKIQIPFFFDSPAVNLQNDILHFTNIPPPSLFS